MRYTVIGCGAAGIAAIRTILKEEPTAQITAISVEAAPFYFRPLLVELFEKEHFSHNANHVPKGLESVTWRTGVRVAKVEPKVNRILLSTGEMIEYDFLLIASGSLPEIDYLGEFRRYVLTIHSLADMKRIQKIPAGAPVLVLGGGYIAVEVIRQFHNCGNPITFFARPDLFWPREVPGLNARDIESLLESVGVSPLFGTEINDVYDHDGDQIMVIDNRGFTHRVAAIVAVPSETPNVGFLQGSGITVDAGVVVNEELRTNFPNVFACGDCAQVLDLKLGINRINFGWRSAEKQGEIAGHNMIGRDTIYVPNSQDFYFLDLIGKNLLDRWAGMETPEGR